MVKNREEKRNWSLRALSPFYHSVFKRHVLYTRKEKGLAWERLMMSIHAVGYMHSENRSLHPILLTENMSSTLQHCRQLYLLIREE